MAGRVLDNCETRYSDAADSAYIDLLPTISTFKVPLSVCTELRTIDVHRENFCWLHAWKEDCYTILAQTTPPNGDIDLESTFALHADVPRAMENTLWDLCEASSLYGLEALI